MKALNKIGLTVFTLILAACQDPYFASTNDDLTVSWFLPENSRTILPSGYTAPVKYDLTLTASGQTTVTQTDVSTTTFTVQNLAYTTWNVAINGKDGSGNVVASGSNTVSVTLAGPNSISVPLAYLTTGGGSGTMDLTVDWSALSGVNVDNVVINLTDPTSTALSPQTLSISSNSARYLNTAARVGTWLATFNLGYQGGTVLSLYETVVVASQATTQKTLTPTLADFRPVPSASSVGIGGLPGVGLTQTGSYAFTMGSGGAFESGTLFQWYRANNTAGTGRTPISGANALNYSATASDDGLYLFFEVTPKDALGITGTAVLSSPTQKISTLPSVTVSPITGPPGVGQVLTANYSFIAGSAAYPSTGTTIQWFRANNSAGTGRTAITSPTSSVNYTATSSDDGQYLFVDVMPRDSASLVGTTVTSAAFGPVHGAPSVSGITISGTASNGSTLSTSYTYLANGSPAESGTTFQWYRTKDTTVNGVAITGATSQSYTVGASDLGYLYVGVRARSSDGVQGTEVLSGLVTCIVSYSNLDRNGVANFDTLGALNEKQVDNSNDAGGYPSLNTGKVLIFRTSDNRYGKAKIINNLGSTSITFDYTVWNSDGSVFSSAANTVISGTWSIDFDTGTQVTDTTGDIKLDNQTSDVRFLTPQNNTQFTIIGTDTAYYTDPSQPSLTSFGFANKMGIVNTTTGAIDVDFTSTATNYPETLVITMSGSGQARFTHWTTPPPYVASIVSGSSQAGISNTADGGNYRLILVGDNGKIQIYTVNIIGRPPS